MWQVEYEKFPQIYLSVSNHTKTLLCYLRSEQPHWHEALTEAMKSWMADRGRTEQQVRAACLHHPAPLPIV